MSDKTIQAFNIGANGSAFEVSYLIVGLVFSVLFLIFAYILKHLYIELKDGNLKVFKFLMVIFRMAMAIVILSYFLL
ncbi:DUF3262 family protein [Pasteurella multocida]